MPRQASETDKSANKPVVGGGVDTAAASAETEKLSLPYQDVTGYEHFRPELTGDRPASDNALGGFFIPRLQQGLLLKRGFNRVNTAGLTTRFTT